MMNKSSLFMSSKKQTLDKKAIFVFLGGHNFWEGLYDTVNISFVRNLINAQMINNSDILMTTIVPRRLSEEKLSLLLTKEENLRNDLQEKKIRIYYYHIRGRTIKGLVSASKDIQNLLADYQHRFLWAQNYFNAFLGVLIKQKQRESHLHFDMRGLVPQEELYYSPSNFIVRFTKYTILKLIERINLHKANSISAVSNQFRHHILQKYPFTHAKIEVLQNFFDHKQFFLSEDLRKQFREKYQLQDQQHLILYSGMLQKWQDPALLFSFIKHLQKQDFNHEFRFMILTYDQEKAEEYAARYGIKDIIIESADFDVLNGFYNAADIGLAFRDNNIASVVSSPVKIPEYLATGNSLILLTSIGDFGEDLRDKPFVLARKDNKDLLKTTLTEVKNLKKPNASELQEIVKKYGIENNNEVIRRILSQPDE